MNITNQTKSIFVCLISAISVPLALGKEEFPLEAWVKQCTITPADLNQRDASAVAGGITLEKHGKWGWSPKVEAAEGVLVLHPLAEDKPGVV